MNALEFTGMLICLGVCYYIGTYLYRITLGRYFRKLEYHQGIDLPLPPENTPVYACRDGIARTGDNMVVEIITDEENLRIIYNHIVVAVKSGQKVKRGDVIGYVTHAPLNMIIE